MWEDQGRQWHMWFGHGTSGRRREHGGSAAGGGHPGRFVPEIDRIAYLAVVHLPRSEGHRAVVAFDGARLDQLRTAMTAWIGARTMSDADFAARFMPPGTGHNAMAQLRAAAEAVRTAAPGAPLNDGSAALAAAMQGVGLSRWAGFLREASERAEAYLPTASPVILAQVTASGVAPAMLPTPPTDQAPAAPGRYVAPDPNRWAGHPSVGTGECVPLVQQATGAPRSTEWRQGVLVEGNMSIRPGTAIATFDSQGHYDSGHAAIYIGQDAHGIQVVDQWNKRDANGNITSKQRPHYRRIEFVKPGADRVDLAGSYYVIE